MLKWPKTNASTEQKKSSRPMIPFILGGQLFVMEAASLYFSAPIFLAPMVSAPMVLATEALVIAAFLLTMGIITAQHIAPVSLVLCTMGSSVLAVIVSIWAEKYSTVVACCIVTAVACIVREPAGASVAGILFAVIVINDNDAAWDWNIIYALVVAFLTSTFFSRVYAYTQKSSPNDSASSDMQIVANAWHQTVTRDSNLFQ